MVNECRKCLFCNKGLRPLKRTSDWDTRKYHKQCHFLRLQLLELQSQYNSQKD